MDISTEISAVMARIAQITGADIPSATGEGQFAALVQAELDRASGGTPVASAEGAPAMIPSAQIDSLVSANASAWQVDPALVKAIIANESGFNANATSRTGAQGLMQLEPDTAASLGVRDSYDPAQNVWGGTRYIRGLLDRFHGDMQLAVAAYNAGPEAVEKYGGVPPYAETQSYVSSVLGSYQKYKAQNP